MNEEELQPKSNQWAPDDEGAKNFVNQYNPQNEMLPFHKTKCSET